MKTGRNTAAALETDPADDPGHSGKNQDTEPVCPEMSDRQLTIFDIIVRPETLPEDLPIWLTVDEVAAFWRVNRKTVYDMIKRGELRARKVGRVNRINRNEVIQSSSGNSRVSRSPRRNR